MKQLTLIEIKALEILNFLNLKISNLAFTEKLEIVRIIVFALEKNFNDLKKDLKEREDYQRINKKKEI